MSVYKSKKSPYYHFDFRWKGRRVHGSTGCTSKRDALAFERAERQKVILPDATRPSITLDDAASLYQDDAEQLPSWPTTRYILLALVTGLGPNKLLSEITQRDLKSYFKGRGAPQSTARGERRRSNATINREIETCRAVWRAAATLNYDVGEMPAWRKLMLEVPDQVPRELTTTEEPALLLALRADLLDFCVFMLKTGWRLTEGLGLRWKDVDFATKTAITRIKGGAVVKRPLTKEMVAILQRQPRVGPYVFTYICQKTKSRYTDKRGRLQPARQQGERYPLTKTVLRKPWAAAKRAAKIENLRFHDLRHTRATRMIRETGNLAATKEALKHRTIKTTLKYAHADDQDVRNALEASARRDSGSCRSSRKGSGNV